MILAEATRLALDAGIDATRIPSALAGGRADSNLLQEYMPRMASADFTQVGRIDIMLKDLQTVARLAAVNGTSLPMIGLATELHRLLVSTGHGAEDNSAVVRLYGDSRAAD